MSNIKRIGWLWTLIAMGLCSSAVANEQPPVISCPPAVNVQCSGDVPAGATTKAAFVAQGGTITLSCPGTVSVGFSDTVTSNGCANKFTVKRKYTVTDHCRNSAQCTQTITVSDPNRADDPEYIVRLIGQVIRVSVETVKIMEALPDPTTP